MADVERTANRAPLNFISEIYDCAIDPARWPGILRGISKLVHGCAAAIISHIPGQEGLRIEARWNTSAKFERATAATAQLNPAVPAIWLLGQEHPFTTDSFFRNEEIRRSLWHRKTLKPEGIGDAAIIPLTRSSDTFSTLMIMRHTVAGAFLAEEIELIAGLSPHFRNAAAIAGMLDFLPLSRHSSCLAELTRTGIILTDARGKILHANTAAERRLDGCALLCLEDELAARDYRSNAMLRETIAKAGSSRNQRTPEQPVSMTVRGQGACALTAWIMPVGEPVGLSIVTCPGARVAVFVRAFERSEPSAAELFVRRHHVTIAESRLLAILMRGIALGEAAHALSVPIAAARSSLSSILQKAGVRDVTDLLSLLNGERRLVSA